MPRTESLVAELLWEHGIVQVNVDKPFALSHGGESPIYLDCRLLPSFPAQFKQISLLLSDLVRRSMPAVCGPACVVGVESSGISWATAVALDRNWPLCYARKAPKGHGTDRLIEGKPEMQCALIDDVLTTGTTRQPALDALETAGVNIFVNAVIVDRRPGAATDCRVKSLTTMRTIIEHAPTSPQVTAELWKWWDDERSKART